MNTSGTSKLRILLVIPTMALGGAEKVVADLTRVWCSRGHTVHIVVYKGNSTIRQLIDERVTIHRLSHTSLISYVWMSFQLARIVKTLSADIVIGIMTPANFLVLTSRIISFGKHILILTEHNTTSTIFGLGHHRFARTKKFLTRILYPLSDRVVAVSNGVANDLVKNCGLKSSHVFVIYNPCFADRIVELSKQQLGDTFEVGSDPLIVAVTRLEPQKNLGLMIRAFAIVRKQIRAKLYLIGDGSQRQTLEQLVDALDLNNDVVFLGFQQNPYKFMGRATLIALSSHYEGFPIALLEAFALGKACVSTDCPSGPRELFQDELSGLLVPPNDTAALAAAMLRVILYPDVRLDLERRAKQRSKDFEAVTIGTTYEQHMRELLKARQLRQQL